jgi:outer membrane scaffolding protein for murein synthesis (MipA/OmpV family)
MRRPAPVLAAALALGAVAVTLSSPARADQPLWELGFGAGYLRLPQYRGSSESHNWLLPVPYFIYRGNVLRADRNGTRAVLFDGERIDFDLSIAASAPVSSDKAAARQGMPNLSPTIEVGPRLNVSLARGPGWKVDLRVPVRAVVVLRAQPRSVGWGASPVINLDLDWSGANVGLQTGPLWGDRRLHGYFYDVAPAYATVARPAYTARGGYAGWQATAALSQRVGLLWLGGFVRHDSLAGAAFADSPLVKRQEQWAVGFGMAWVFATADQRVPDGR